MSQLHLESGGMWGSKKHAKFTASKIINNTSDASHTLLQNNYCSRCKDYFDGNCSRCGFYPLMSHQTEGGPRADESTLSQAPVNQKRLSNLTNLKRRTNIDVSKVELDDFSEFGKKRAIYQIEKESGIEIDINNTCINLETRKFTFAFRQDGKKFAVSGGFVTENINIQSPKGGSKIATQQSNPRILKGYEWESGSGEFFTSPYKLNKNKRRNGKITSEKVFHINKLNLCIKNILDQLLLEQSI